MLMLSSKNQNYNAYSFTVESGNFCETVSRCFPVQSIRIIVSMIPLAAVHPQGSGHPNKRQQTKMHYLSFSVILFKVDCRC